MTTLQFVLIVLVAAFLLLFIAAWLSGIRYIPHGQVGIVEKLWSSSGSLEEGRIIATDGRAGFQAEVLRGGVHVFYYPWQYRIHRQPLVLIAQGRMGYVYARDGEPLTSTQTLGRTAPCNHFQDAAAFLAGRGQRGRQRAILREGLYAINLAQFVVITDTGVFSGPIKDRSNKLFDTWHAELMRHNAFKPVRVGEEVGEHVGARNETSAIVGDASEITLEAGDNIGVVTVHDGPSLMTGEIIAPEVKAPGDASGHGCFQDPEAFMAMGGHRGKQLQVLTDGTYFINRWFATVELRPKTLIPIGYVGVVVSYHGIAGQDVTGIGFRYGEQVEAGQRGVWKQALPPGKYPLNPYALKVELVPTVNFVLRWITGSVEAHRYDENLESIELITADGFEPVLPLSLVLHIDYEKAPRVIQRFGDVKRLISQTLDPILSAYFRDVAQSSNMLDLLMRRDEIQKVATAELGRRFQEYDITCIAVLIGRPESKKCGQADDPIARLYDQLRQRRIAEEQVATFARQQEAATKMRQLREAEAAAQKQTELTQAELDVTVARSRGDAELARAERLARRDVARAEGRSRSRELLGKGEASRIGQVGAAEADVFGQKIAAYGDPRLFALNLLGRQLAQSAQPLVPERILLRGGGAGGDGATAGANAGGMFGQLMALMLAERAGIDDEARPPNGNGHGKPAVAQVKAFPPQSMEPGTGAPPAGEPPR